MCGSILWPRRSPDVTPLDFFCLGFCKELGLYGQNSRPKNFESRNEMSRRAGSKGYAIACIARSGILGIRKDTTGAHLEAY